jgi:hypothetical protein
MIQKANSTNFWLQKLKASAMIAFLILLVLTLIIVAAQETFKDILIPLGLYHNRSGALIECSRPGSDRSRYCNSNNNAPSHERSLSKDPKDSKGFDLF